MEETDIRICIMQEIYEKKSKKKWYADVTREKRELLVKRFYRIIYERYANPKGMQELDERQFLNDRVINEKNDISEKIEFVKKETDIVKWDYSIEENKIKIIFKNSVYSGDLYNRL